MPVPFGKTNIGVRLIRYNEINKAVIRLPIERVSMAVVFFFIVIIVARLTSNCLRIVSLS